MCQNVKFNDVMGKNVQIAHGTHCPWGPWPMSPIVHVPHWPCVVRQRRGPFSLQTRPFLPYGRNLQHYTDNCQSNITNTYDVTNDVISTQKPYKYPGVQVPLITIVPDFKELTPFCFELHRPQDFCLVFT